jgi:hypothetical protein
MKKKTCPPFHFYQKIPQTLPIPLQIYINLYKFDHIGGKGTSPGVVWPIFAHKDESL